jgi:hypothetical protein
MSTVLPPDQAGPTVDAMNVASGSATGQMLNAEAAANADELGEGRPLTEHSGLEAGGAWDSYEVWRRFIKDARDRRKSETESLQETSA